MAHVGVLKALEEMGVEPHVVAGASAGAIVGALYAAGNSVETISQLFRTVPLFHWSYYTWQKPGILDSEKYYDVLKPFFKEDSYESLQKQLFVAATDLINGDGAFFSSGPLITSILASSAYPGVFSPVLIDGNYYADGGIVCNFPTEPLLETCDKIIGVFVNPIQKIDPEELKTTRDLLERTFMINQMAESRDKFDDCDILVLPQGIEKYSIFSKNHLDIIFEAGYKEAMKKKEQFQSLQAV
jgi:NTE family protein